MGNFRLLNSRRTFEMFPRILPVDEGGVPIRAQRADERSEGMKDCLHGHIA